MRRLILSLILASSVHAAVPAAGQDWAEYLGNPERNHYSLLRQITAGNVTGLKLAWTYHTGDFGRTECNPLVVGGRLYAVSAMGDVFALDAASGQPLWRYQAEPTRVDKVHRGLAYWAGDDPPRIFYTADSWLGALDARTGAPIASFGSGGRISLRTGLRESSGRKWVDSTSPGTIMGDLIIMPLRVDENQYAAVGYIQAFNVRTGKLAWVFHTIPLPGEPGYETWPPAAYRNFDVGSANSWCGMAVDRTRGILYVPTGSAAPDFWGGARIGADLYANCLLALEARTGRLIWHYQFVHHDVWDRDLPSPPVLATIKRNGRRVDAVIQTTKLGYTYVFDRTNGQPLFPIEEKPFPPSDLPGEKTWPTQPLPVLPAPFARQGIGPDDISPYAENRQELLDRLHAARRGTFLPFSTTETALLPGFDGGGEWGGPAVDPKGVMYVNANEQVWMVRLAPAPSDEELAAKSPGRQVYRLNCQACHGPDRLSKPGSMAPPLVGLGARRTKEDVAAFIATGKGMMPGFPQLDGGEKQALLAYLFDEENPAAAGHVAAHRRVQVPYVFQGYNRFVDSKGHPAITPPWGTLTAIDLNTGKFLWHRTLGEFRDLTAKGAPPTGCENYGGPVVTAGGVLFIGATKDAKIRAFDPRTGELLWSADLPAASNSTPAVYSAAGKEYVAIACGGDRNDPNPGDCYQAFALP